MKNEDSFIEELEKRAREQRKLVGTEVLPSWAKGVGEWLVVNPWRVLVPLSAIVYLGWRTLYGAEARELLLGLFGGY